MDDLEKEWTWSKPFDYIFSRMMVGSFADWDAYIKQASEYGSIPVSRYEAQANFKSEAI